MTILAVVLTLAFGVFVGMLSGLLGIGGGVLNVPYLYGLFEGGSWTGIRIPLESQTVMAHATSLAVIIPTALSGAWVHHRAGRVDWSVAAPMALGAMVGAPLGAQAAIGVDPVLLRALFGGVLLALGLRLGIRQWRISRMDADASTPQGWKQTGPQGGLRTAVAVTLGLFEGAFAALLGIGGAAVTIPLLIWFLRVDMARLAGTAIMVVIAAATAGVVSYARAPELPGLESVSLGLVFLPAAAGLIPGAVVMAQVGARINHRMEKGKLILLFSLLLSLIGLRLLGAFVFGELAG